MFIHFNYTVNLLFNALIKQCFSKLPLSGIRFVPYSLTDVTADSPASSLDLSDMGKKDLFLLFQNEKMIVTKRTIISEQDFVLSCCFYPVEERVRKKVPFADGMPHKAPPITNCLYSSVSGLCAHYHFSCVDSTPYTPIHPYLVAILGILSMCRIVKLK